MHQHQAKKPYNGSQPTIASYFSQHAGLPSSRDQYDVTSPSTPLLPTAVQSGLVNVGMRVRKSVPEGYKTGTYSAFSLFSDNTVMATSKPQSRTTRPRAGARELLPFSGILKVGGLGNQQWGIFDKREGQGWDSYNASSSEGEMDEDDIPVLSQGSDSSLGSPSGANKRRFFDDEEEGLEPFEGMGGSPSFSQRVLAVPRRKKYGGAKGQTVAQQGQFVFGTGAGVQVAGEDADFEDAPFLDYTLAAKGAGEVEMSG